jgi:hypothetical protein
MSNLKDKQGEEEVKEANWKEAFYKWRETFAKVDGNDPSISQCVAWIDQNYISELTRLTDSLAASERFRVEDGLKSAKRIAELEQGLIDIFRLLESVFTALDGDDIQAMRNEAQRFAKTIPSIVALIKR